MFVGIAVLALALSACTRTSGDESTDSTEVPPTAAVEDPTTDVAPEVLAMCRTLTLYSAARVPPATAAEALLFVDLEDATSQEMAAYGDLLISAPEEECPEQFRYAEAIQYWLGF